MNNNGNTVLWIVIAALLIAGAFAFFAYEEQKPDTVGEAITKSVEDIGDNFEAATTP